MTIRGGSHNAIASSSPREDDEVVGDDPKLRAMRAVWLTMRDEDPPDRGLTELLAVARRTAEAMQARPTLWQRLVAGLRRPPALALATVMVLLGGALVLGRRGVGELAPARAPAVAGATATSSPSALTPVSPAEGAGAPAKAKAAPSGAAAADHPVTASVPDGSAQAGREDQRTRSGAASAPRAPGGGSSVPGAASAQAASGDDGSRFGAVPVKVAAPGKRSGKLAQETALVSDEQPPADPAPVDRDGNAADSRAGGKSSPMLQRGPSGPPPSSPSAATGSAPLSAPAPAKPLDDAEEVAPAAHGARLPAAAAADADADAEKKADRVEAGTTNKDKQAARPATSLAQLYQQCEAAARRGDCAAVRLLVERITKTDRGYRARVAKGSPVATCLADMTRAR
jgi:hypothetical protein